MRASLSGSIRSGTRLRAQPVGEETLERLLRWPGLRRKFGGSKVMIYSDEHGSYWRKSASGYSLTTAGAGSYSIDEAISLTKHCGPEKGIRFRSISVD